MRGSIYTDQRCPICGGTFYHDDHRRGLFCARHPDQRADGQFRVQFGRKIRRRFKTYVEAERFLDGLRYEVDQGKFFPKDYRPDNPLSFRNLSQKWLGIKEKEVRPRTLSNLENYIGKALESWGDMNVRHIGYAEIEDFLHAQEVADKTKANIKSCLHSFFTWCNRREGIPIPDMPEVRFELAWRRTVDKDTQAAIISEVRKISYEINPKIWLGIKWLSTYISVRPAELTRIRESGIDPESGYFFIPHPKERKAKVVPLIDEDIEIIRGLDLSSSDIFFFRHTGRSGCRDHQPFGGKYFWKWWKRACKNLNVEGVDLYGGTRHSSAMALRGHATPEEIKRSLMSSTNKAFERYFRVESDDLRNIYELTRKKRRKDNG